MPKVSEGSAAITLHPNQVQALDAMALQFGMGNRNKLLRYMVVSAINAHKAHGESLQIEEMIDEILAQIRAEG